MMNRIRKKMNSDRGASITFALMIFLVCAVVGSAVLVAGTAASGRMSKAVENDQRYYAVNSAARLLISQIDNNSVIIVKEEKSSGTEYYKNEIALGNKLDPNTTPLDSIPIWTAYQMMSNAAGLPFSFRFDLMAVSGTEIGELAVELSEKIEGDPYGKMTIEIQQTSGNPERTYIMNLLFNLDKSEVIDSQTGADGTTTVTTDTFTWHLRDIQVSGSGIARG